MFFPDKAQAFAETRRVLAPGGAFLFNAWDRIEDNEIADTVTTALATLFPRRSAALHGARPARLSRSRSDRRRREAGRLRRAAAHLDGRGAQHRAIGAHRGEAYCLGTPLRNEIEARDPNGLDRAAA